MFVAHGDAHVICFLRFYGLWHDCSQIDLAVKWVTWRFASDSITNNIVHLYGTVTSNLKVENYSCLVFIKPTLILFLLLILSRVENNWLAAENISIKSNNKCFQFKPLTYTGQMLRSLQSNYSLICVLVLFYFQFRIKGHFQGQFKLFPLQSESS